MDCLCEASCDQGASGCCELLTKLLSLHNAGQWFLISESEMMIRRAVSSIARYRWPTLTFIFCFFLVDSSQSRAGAMCWICLPAYLSWWSYKQTNNLCAWPRTSSSPPGSRSCRGTEDTPSICCPGPLGQKSKFILIVCITESSHKKDTFGHLLGHLRRMTAIIKNYIWVSEQKKT